MIESFEDDVCFEYCPRTYRNPLWPQADDDSPCITPPNEARFLTVTVWGLFGGRNDIKDERRCKIEVRIGGRFSTMVDDDKGKLKWDFKCSCHHRYNLVQLSVDVMIWNINKKKENHHDSSDGKWRTYSDVIRLCICSFRFLLSAVNMRKKKKGMA